MQVKKQDLELYIEQRLVPNWERSTSRIYILSPCLFNFYSGYIMKNGGLDEAQQESRLPGEISITSDM